MHVDAHAQIVKLSRNKLALSNNHRPTPAYFSSVLTLAKLI